jgi:adenine-specific DNA-methyltransferase
MDARGEIYWSSSGNPRRKIYLEASEGIPVQDIWMDFRDAHNQNINITGYPTEKNPALLARIIQASSNEDDLVLDCFAGSGTTLAAAAQYKRRWIGIDNSSEAISTMLRRFARGLEPMGDFVSKDTSPVSRNEPRYTASLWDASENQKKPDQNLSEKHHIVRDFTLFSAGNPANEIKGALLAQWLEWMREISLDR